MASPRFQWANSCAGFPIVKATFDVSTVKAMSTLARSR
jgi:hypothetical protein